MGAFGTVVIGNRETLRRPGAIAPHETPLDWPDQGGAESNWAVNSRLLARMIAAGTTIRDADVRWGVPACHSGFLARERRQLRAAGLVLGPAARWATAGGSFVEVAPRLLQRARAAAAAGRATFPVPEAAPVAAWIAARVVDPALRRQAMAWLGGRMGYHALVRLCARATPALDPIGAAPQPVVFRPKVAGELEGMLALWPHVLVLPTPVPLSRGELIRLRALPVHPLGLIDAPAWADGASISPSEYFFHDLDHARFKVREDLLARGVAIPDAYQDGTTIDPRGGGHRSILKFAGPGVRRAFAAGAPLTLGPLTEALRPRGDVVGQALQLLLFELVHEKSLPLTGPVLARAARDDAPLLRLARKRGSGFLGADTPSAEVMAALPVARDALRRLTR